MTDLSRRGFMKWLGGGVAAVVALSQANILKAQELYGVTGEVDPASTLWLPGEAKILVPEDKPLVIATRAAGVGVFRVTQVASYRSPGYVCWFDPDWRLVDAFDAKGQPTSIFGSDGPDVNAIKRAVGPIGDEWRYLAESRKPSTAKGAFVSDAFKRDYKERRERYGALAARFDVLTPAGVYVSAWPELIYESAERPCVATVSLGPITTDGA